jgi:taurine transport system permease protein
MLIGLCNGMCVGWRTGVAPEMAAADADLGKMVSNASKFLRTDVVILDILVISFVAYAFEMLMRWIEGWAVTWQGKA